MNKRKWILPVFFIGGASLILILTVLAAVLSVNHVPVLSEWTNRTDKTEYREGDTVMITANFDKIYDIQGQSSRQLTCLNEGRNQKYGAAFVQDTNAPKGDDQTRVSEARIPSSLIDGLPKQCYYSYEVKYNLYGFQSDGKTNNFTVRPKE